MTVARAPDKITGVVGKMFLVVRAAAMNTALTVGAMNEKRVALAHRFQR